jgi:hypothetical protein
MAFLGLYKTKRANKNEVRYNVARAMQLLGLNISAEQVYSKLISECQNEEILTRSKFNLSQLLKGSGINTGVTLKGMNVCLSSAEQRRDRINDL